MNSIVLPKTFILFAVSPLKMPITFDIVPLELSLVSGSIG